MYSQKRNCAASVPFPTFMVLWTIYTFPESSTYLAAAKETYRSWNYINLSQIQYISVELGRRHYNSVLEITRLHSFISRNTSIGTWHLYLIINGPSFAVHPLVHLLIGYMDGTNLCAQSTNALAKAERIWKLTGPRSPSFRVPRNLSKHMDRQARTGDTVLVKSREVGAKHCLVRWGGGKDDRKENTLARLG
jgi:hypothetical protein